MQVPNKDVEQEIVSVEDDVDKDGALKTTLREQYRGSSGAPDKTLEVSVEASRWLQTLGVSAARGSRMHDEEASLLLLSVGSRGAAARLGPCGRLLSAAVVRRSWARGAAVALPRAAPELMKQAQRVLRKRKWAQRVLR
jgi:hypothetical protein